MVSKRRERLEIFEQDGVTVVSIGDVEIWDGADLALLRETLTKVIEVDKCRSLGVDMASVKYIPSGFFGMLFEWYERGVLISLFSPQPNVENMLWFRLFFKHHSANRFILQDDPNRLPTPPPSSDWTHDELPEELQVQIREEVAPLGSGGSSDSPPRDVAESMEHANQ
ncbi:MAG: STAS domain-containing protein [Planctomycetaceae bacterium]